MGAISTLAIELTAHEISPVVITTIAGALPLTISVVQLIRSQRRQQMADDSQLDALRRTVEAATSDLVISVDRKIERSTQNTPDPLGDVRARAGTNYEFLAAHYANALSQSKVYAALSYVVGVLGFLMMLAGVAIVYLGNRDPGFLTTVVGAVVDAGAGLVFVQSRKANSDSQDNARQLGETAREDTNREFALHMVSLIDDPAIRNQALSELARQAMSSQSHARAVSAGLPSTSDQPSKSDREKPEN